MRLTAVKKRQKKTPTQGRGNGGQHYMKHPSERLGHV